MVASSRHAALPGRARGRAWLGPSFDYLLFMRPRQWPILSCQFSVGILTAPAVASALSSSPPARGAVVAETAVVITLLAAWAAWVVGLNGGTLAFNSAYDRDIEDVAYLRRPPEPPAYLAAFSLLLMIWGAVLAWSVARPYGFLTAFCVGLSVLYSHPRTRWKGVPGLDLIVNMIGYGAGTTLAGLLVGQVMLAAPDPHPTPAGWGLVGGFGFLFGSFYPLTQIYQIAADRRRGDRTLATALGVRASLALAILLGILAAVAFLAAAGLHTGQATLRSLGPVAVALIAWLGHLVLWLVRAPGWSERQHERGMYRALALWALVDASILWSWYGQRG
jgi:4-hydroxybenzoate polyprenyltransferase